MMQLRFCLLLMLLLSTQLAAEQEDSVEWPVVAEIVYLKKLSDAARETLREARSYDYAFVGQRGDQMKAIAAYKRYLQLAPKDDPSLILNPMCRISYLYANSYESSKGEKHHLGKATDQCRRVFKLAKDNGIVSVEITDLRKLYMTCTLDRLERAKRITENYRWYTAITREDIQRNFANCDKYGRYIGSNPGLTPSFPVLSRRQFGKMVESVRTRCLDKVEETISYARRIEVLGVFEKNFSEADLGRELWRKVQASKQQLIDDALGVETRMDELLQTVTTSASMQPKDHVRALSRPISNDGSKVESEPRNEVATPQGRGSGRWFSTAPIAIVAVAMVTIGLGAACCLKRRARRKQMKNPNPHYS